MYNEKIIEILEDVENKEIEIAGGSVVGIVLSTVTSLIKYISNLTFGKEKYANVQDKVQEIFNEADLLKRKALLSIDKDKEVLEEILQAYKIRKTNEEKYLEVCKKSVEFCMEVLQMAYKIFILSNDISKVGNKMLSSDFEICKYYSIASVKSAIVNVKINLQSINDKEYVDKINFECEEILEKIEGTK